MCAYIYKLLKMAEKQWPKSKIKFLNSVQKLLHFESLYMKMKVKLGS